MAPTPFQRGKVTELAKGQRSVERPAAAEADGSMREAKASHGGEAEGDVAAKHDDTEAKAELWSEHLWGATQAPEEGRGSCRRALHIARKHLKAKWSWCVCLSFRDCMKGKCGQQWWAAPSMKRAAMGHRMSLPGSESCDPRLARASKARIDDRLAADFFMCVDNMRTLGGLKWEH